MWKSLGDAKVDLLDKEVNEVFDRAQRRSSQPLEIS